MIANKIASWRRQREEDDALEHTLSVLRLRLKDMSQQHPRIIHVETRTRCNGTCSFCAAAIQSETRPDILMLDELIDKILDELEAAGYTDRLSFYNNNEPFLDKRIIDIIAKARQRLPGVYLELKTNGKNLNLDKVYALFQAGLDTLYVNDYVGDAEYEAGTHRKNIRKPLDELPRLRRFRGHFKGDSYNDRIIVQLRRENAVLNTRAGTAPNKSVPRELESTVCLRPFEMLVINPNGDVALCSEDLRFEEIMGNIRDQGMFALWRSQKYNGIRARLLDGDRPCMSTCAQCDYRGYTLEILREVEEVSAVQVAAPRRA